MTSPADHPRTALTGWGRTAPTVATLQRVTTADQVVEAVRGTEGRRHRGVIARGLGRSYGDAAQNAGGRVLDMTGLDRVLGVDSVFRTVDVEAGVSLDTLMQVLLPFGLWVPVLPGTRQVTVGGAIAADVHGKNHHVAGSFGDWVRSLDLLTADGDVRTLTPDSAAFWATVGGMGLTGIVLRATLAVQRTQTAWFVVDTERADNLDDLMARLSSDDDRYPYSVAWFDALASGRRLGRAVLTRGRAATLDDLGPDRVKRARDFVAPSFGSVPDHLPPGLLNRWTGRAFNEMWFRKAPRRRAGELQDITTFFHPLDVIGEWNRLYGPRGFCQYQFVVPPGAEDVFKLAVRDIAASGQVSSLNVLKRFGPGNAAPLSFPTAGWTLAVDLPVTPGLERLFSRLDAMVADAGGRVYLAKDSRLRADLLRRMYPRLEEFCAVRADLDPHGVFRSDLSRRLQL
jgi:decaprenylphospho-beta-D-ribofuranose 2-oxidase